MSGELFHVNSTALPALLAVTRDRASMRFLEFFAANIRKPHTRRAYYRAPRNFLAVRWNSSTRLVFLI